MSTFSVTPAALRAYAGTISGAGGHGGVNLAHLYIQRPRPYVQSYVTIDTSSGASNLFQLILSSNSTLVSNLQTTYDDIWPLLSDSGLALKSSADDYQTTDANVNEKMDRVWHGSGAVPALDDRVSGGIVDDPAKPLDEVPESEVEIPDPVHWVMDTAGWLSIGNDALKIASLLGFDPAGELTKAIAGDYSMVARAGHAAAALSEFETNTAQTIAAGLEQMTKQWTGHAADAATAYFRTWANAFETHAAQLDEVSNKYAQIAQAVAEVATLLSGLLATAIDKLLICGASLAAAGCLQEVPGVDVLVDLIGAYEVWTTKEAVEAFVKACTAVTDASETVVMLAVGIAGLCESGSARSMFPTAGYSNGAQA